MMKSDVWKSVIVIGMVFLLLSFAPGNLVNRSIGSDDGLFTGVLVITNSDVTVNVLNYGDSNFSLYMLEYSDGLQLLADESLNNVSPFFICENIDNYRGFIDIPADGAYLLVITNTSSSYMGVAIIVDRATPHLRLFASGLVLMILGVTIGRKEILDIINQIQSKRKEQ
ncbi:MAG: hypothetical protein ACTSWA_06335 [Candidatus Thorarchaeota archaeon]